MLQATQLVKGNTKITGQAIQLRSRVMLNYSHEAAGQCQMSLLVVYILLLNISCEKCIASTNRRAGGVVSVSGTAGAAAKVAPRKTPFYLGR